MEAARPDRSLEAVAVGEGERAGCAGRTEIWNPT